jgi:hypothetical protein
MEVLHGLARADVRQDTTRRSSTHAAIALWSKQNNPHGHGALLAPHGGLGGMGGWGEAQP